jgi:hypothetical protein
MSNQQNWLELLDSDYLDNFKKAQSDNEIHFNPLIFKNEKTSPLPLQLGHKKKYYNILIDKTDILTSEYIENNELAIYFSGSEITDLHENKIENIYFAASVGLNSVKLKAINNIENKKLNLGIDPYSLGLWQSKLFKSHFDISKIIEKLNKDTHLFRISTLAYDMAGSNLVQQLAITMSSCVQLIKDYMGEIKPEEIIKLVSFEVSLNSNILLNIVKLQSIRILLNRLKELYQDNRDYETFIVSIASPRSLVSREIWNNILRLTSVNISSIMGGADGCIHQAYDLFAKDNNLRLSRNINLILNNESFVNKVNFPTLGSYSVDNMCEEYCKKSWEFFQEIENKGGLTNTLRSGWLQNEISISNKNEVDLFLSRRKKITGVNDYVLLKSLSDENPMPTQDEVIEIQHWWDRFFYDEENEKLCDVEKLIPIQLSSFFEKWQLKADSLREQNVSTSISLYVEPGLDKGLKVAMTKKILSLCGLQTQLLTEPNLKASVLVLIASEPEGEFTKSYFEKRQQKKSQLILWAGEKLFNDFDGHIGETANLMELFALIFNKLEENL